YLQDGAIRARWGDLSKPQFHLYDAVGRLTELRTYRTLAPGTEPNASTPGFDATQWTYNNRGLLLSKRDAGSQGADFTYTDAGRIRTRKWARGAWTRYDYSAGYLA